MLSAALGLHHNEGLSITRIAETMAAAPARILGLETGRLAPGAPADLIVIDLQLNWKVEDNTLKSRSKNSPFEHRTMEGRAVETVVAGQTVFAYA
jgi:dihydroorotase